MQDPNGDNIPDLHELVRILDERLTELADVNQSGAVGSEFDKHAKVSDADNQSRKHGSRFESIHGRNVAA